MHAFKAGWSVQGRMHAFSAWSCFPLCCLLGLQEVELLGRLAGFEVAAVHGDFNREVSLGHEDAYRMIACLRRLQK